MSTKIFCHNCGKQMPVKVNFCPSCGTNLSSLSSQISSPKPSTFEPFVAKGDDDDEDNNYLDKLHKLDIRINGLQVDIVKDRPPGETLGSIISQPSDVPPSPIQNNRPTNTQNSKDFWADFSKEAGTLRNQKNNG